LRSYKPRQEITHLIGAGKAGFIDKIEVPPVLGGSAVRTSKETLQGSSLNACLAKLACRARGRSEAFDLITLHLGGAADDGKRGRLPRASISLDSLNTVVRAEYILNHALLGTIEMRMLVGK
jgi:hypothetical protein